MLGLGSRLRAWVQRRSSHGASAGAILRELPRHLLSKSTDVVLQAINRRLMTPARQEADGARIRQALRRCERAPYVLVLVPEILHYALPCIELASRSVSVVVLLNGVPRRERAILSEAFPALPVVELRPVPGSLLPHGLVLDVLLRHADRDVTLLDPDLYVFDPTVFDEMVPTEGEVAVGVYGVQNRKTGLRLPTTHLLSLDVALLQGVMQRHRIGARIYDRTPAHLVQRLSRLGIGDHNFPKDHLSFYDPLNLLLAVAMSDGLRMRVLDRDESAVFHVGGVSYFRRSMTLDYFTLRLLELPYAASFAERYRDRLVATPSVAEARQKLQAHGHTETASRIDHTVERLAEVMRGR